MQLSNTNWISLKKTTGSTNLNFNQIVAEEIRDVSAFPQIMKVHSQTVNQKASLPKDATEGQTTNNHVKKRAGAIAQANANT